MNPEETLDSAESAGAGRGAAAVARAVDGSDQIPLAVVIVYEDAPAARRALRVMADLAVRSRDQVGFTPSLWRFDLLEYRQWREVAARDVLASEIIIVATCEAAELRPDVNRWLGGCLADRAEMNTAVLALYGTGDDWSLSLRDGSNFYTARQTEMPRKESNTDENLPLEFADCI